MAGGVESETMTTTADEPRFPLASRAVYVTTYRVSSAARGLIMVRRRPVAGSGGLRALQSTSSASVKRSVRAMHEALRRMGGP